MLSDTAASSLAARGADSVDASFGLGFVGLKGLPGGKRWVRGGHWRWTREEILALIFPTQTPTALRSLSSPLPDGTVLALGSRKSTAC